MSEDSERIVLLAEVKEMLEKAESAREELTYEQKLALEHARRFAKFSAANAKKLVDDLKALDKVDPVMALRIVDLAPIHGDDVRALFSKSRITLDDADVQKILDTVAKYLDE